MNFFVVNRVLQLNKATMETYDYHCPKCRTSLNIGQKLIFSVSNQNDQRGLILLSPKIGEYKTESNTSFKYKKGELLQFHCPCCSSELTSKKHREFAEIIMKVNDLIEFEVLFSMRAGVRRTYLITEDYVEKHGEEIENFEELFEL